MKVFEKYYDYDYHTGKPENDDDIISTTQTGMSFYNSFLNDLSYMQKYKNLTGEIVKLSPQEYYEACNRFIFNDTSVDALKKSRGVADKSLVDELVEIIETKSARLCLPILDYADKSQEGLHRMYAIAEVYGWDKRVPVLVVKWYDYNKHIEDVKLKAQMELNNNFEDACHRALQYAYPVDKVQEYLFEQIKDELSYKIYNHEKLNDIYENLKLTIHDGVAHITSGQLEYEGDIRIEEPEELEIDEEDISDDDISDDDLQRLLNKYR